MGKVTIDTDYFLTLVQGELSRGEAPMVPPMTKEPVVVKKERAPRAPSAYNLYMKDEIKKLKQEHPELDNKKLFAMASSNYTAGKKAKAAAASEGKQ
jgi:hypothetical protein